jgi:hypothetical protein
MRSIFQADDARRNRGNAIAARAHGGDLRRVIVFKGDVIGGKESFACRRVTAQGRRMPQRFRLTL